VALAPSGGDTGPTTPTTGAPRRRLLRQLAIACPTTGLVTPTGLEISDVPAVVSGPQLLTHCLECGQDHSWRIDDAVLGY
jgi:hypothetical protein